MIFCSLAGLTRVYILWVYKYTLLSIFKYKFATESVYSLEDKYLKICRS